MFSQAKWLERMLTKNDLKSKIIHTRHYFDKGQPKTANNDIDFDTKIEKYSCWSILLLDKLKIEAKIIHKGRGKFRILEDKYKGKYVNKIVDASDVIRCIVNSDDDKTYNIVSKDKLAQFSNKKQYINLETYKKTGEPVRTPMWFVNYNNNIYVSTTGDSRKVKRLRNNSHVRIAPCDFIGHTNGEWIEAKANIVNSNESEKANKLLKQKYGLQTITTYHDIVEEVVISICQRSIY
jgi:PPOX class probable F420-dependent enzyme